VPGSIKNRLALMPRNNFVDMLKDLPWSQQVAIEVSPPDLTDQAVSIMGVEGLDIKIFQF
jgi:hypothetical protein